MGSRALVVRAAVRRQYCGICPALTPMESNQCPSTCVLPPSAASSSVVVSYTLAYLGVCCARLVCSQSQEWRHRYASHICSSGRRFQRHDGAISAKAQSVGRSGSCARARKLAGGSIGKSQSGQGRVRQSTGAPRAIGRPAFAGGGGARPADARSRPTSFLPLLGVSRRLARLARPRRASASRESSTNWPGTGQHSASWRCAALVTVLPAPRRAELCVRQAVSRRSPAPCARVCVCVRNPPFSFAATVLHCTSAGDHRPARCRSRVFWARRAVALAVRPTRKSWRRCWLVMIIFGSHISALWPLH
jgi:hypothetical protein